MILDLPDHLLQHLLGHCSFRQQTMLAATGRRLQAAVDDTWREAGLARARDPDSAFPGEALPRVADLGVTRDPVGTAGALGLPRYGRVLATFDRLVPPPPGDERPLHRWWRGAAELEAQADRVVHRTYGLGGLTYVGTRDDYGDPDGFGMTLIGEDVCDPYVGAWAGGVPQGLGLLMVGGAQPYAWYHGMFEDGEPVDRGAWSSCRGRTVDIDAFSDRNWRYLSPLLTVSPEEWGQTTAAEHDAEEAEYAALRIRVARRYEF